MRDGNSQNLSAEENLYVARLTSGWSRDGWSFPCHGNRMWNEYRQRENERRAYVTGISICWRLFCNDDGGCYRSHIRGTFESFHNPRLCVKKAVPPRSGSHVTLSCKRNWRYSCKSYSEPAWCGHDSMCTNYVAVSAHEKFGSEPKNEICYTWTCYKYELTLLQAECRYSRSRYGHQCVKTRATFCRVLPKSFRVFSCRWMLSLLSPRSIYFTKFAYDLLWGYVQPEIIIELPDEIFRASYLHKSS